MDSSVDYWEWVILVPVMVTLIVVLLISLGKNEITCKVSERLIYIMLKFNKVSLSESLIGIDSNLFNPVQDLLIHHKKGSMIIFLATVDFPPTVAALARTGNQTQGH